MSKSQKWRERQRAYVAGQLHEWHTAQEAAPTVVNVPTAPTPANPFDAAYSGHPITPEAASWDDRGYMKWTLETCSAGSRSSSRYR